MSGKLGPKSDPKIAWYQIFIRDINTYRNNSDPTPILLIFCFFSFLVFIFALLFAAIFLEYLKPAPEEAERLTMQEFNFFLESTNFFEAQNNTKISLSNPNVPIISSQDNISLQFNTPVVSTRVLPEILEIVSKAKNEDNKNLFFPIAERQNHDLDFLEELTITLPDSIFIQDETWGMKIQSDRRSGLPGWWLSDRHFQGNERSPQRFQLAPVANISKNPIEPILEKRDRIGRQSLEKNQNGKDEFSAKIAIVNLQHPSLPKSWNNPPTEVPEPGNGLGLILIFILTIALMGRSQK